MEPSQAIELALEHHRSGEFAQAETIYRQLLTVHPECFDAWHLLGVLSRQTGKVADAIELIAKALSINDREPAAFNNLGVAYQAAGQPHEAEIRYRRALLLRPDYADAHYNLGIVLGETGRYGEAETSYRNAARFNPGGVKAWNNLGATLRELGKPEEAVAAYEKAVALGPSADICGNLGATLRGLGRVKDAETAYRKAIALDPDFVEAHHNLALVLLLQGNYEEGLARYESRFGVGTGKRYQELILSRFPPQGRWRGEPLTGRSLLVVTEQGFGDSLMMMRYLPLLKGEKLQRLTVCCHSPSLFRMMRTIPGVDDVTLLEEVDFLGEFDLYCPIMSLPYLLGSRLETIPHSFPYLTAPLGMKAFWRNRLDGMKGMKVGLAWAGCRLNQADAQRSIHLNSLAPLMTAKGVRFVSLQQGDEARRQLKSLCWEITDWMDECPDFLDTAALVDELDLIITVDTAIAHLAGGLGKPVWLLNRFASEWRWMMGRDDSPWYPGMKIFRQQFPGDWEGVIRRIAQEPAIRRGNNRWGE